jgi:predicted metal-binding transcription factor (methanogenesis marker protein 9)
MSNKNIVSTKECDYLESDPPIRGQKYCCISFISPEDVIKQKEVFFFESFLTAFSKDINDFFDKSAEAFKDNESILDQLNALKQRYDYVTDTSKLQEEFNFYKSVNNDKLEGTYLEKNNFQTSIRGFKIRGSYETIKEAQIRAHIIKKMDNKFNVFIAEVGCWCPWSPDPNELEDQEYAESNLNTLMKGYRDNQSMKDEFYMKRKEMLTQEMIEKKRAHDEKQKAEAEAQAAEASEKPEQTEQPEAEPVVLEEQKESDENLVDITKQLDSDDAWMQRKENEAQQKDQDNINE